MAVTELGLKENRGVIKMKNTETANPEVAKSRNSRSKDKRNGTGRLVRFEIAHPAARSVCVAGTFNGWKPENGTMARTDAGKWTAEVELEPGAYEYRFVVDGAWMQDPNAKASAPNPFGESNSIVTVY